MDSFSSNNVSLDPRVLLNGIIVLFVIVGIVISRRGKKLAGLPVMTGYGSDHEKALMEGTLKYPTTPFIVETTPPLVILPMCVLEELKNIPQSKASPHEEQKRAMVARYTGLFQHNVQMAEAISFDLNRHLASTLTEVEEEVSYVFEKELGAPEDWKTFPLYHKVVRIVARLTSGVFVGPRLSRDDDWTNLLLQLTVSLLAARDAIKKYPEFIQPIAGPLLPEIRSLNRYISRVAKMLEPIISNSVMEDSAKQQPVKNKEETKVNLGAEDEEHEGSFMSWILKRMKTAQSNTLARVQVSLSFGSIHTTTNALTFMFLDLATRPEYTQPLRDEIEEVVKEDRVEADENGVLKFKQSSLAKLKKLDSFMKESSRMSKNPITNLRMAMAPITLSTGHKIPKGTRMAFNSGAVHTSTETRTYSPKYNPSENKPPNEFDGFRFYNLRKLPGNEYKHLFVTVGPDSLTFGYGNHACPGRFFASNELKVILIEFLRNWEFKVADGIQTNSKSMRHLHELFMVPPRKAEIQLRRRKK